MGLTLGEGGHRETICWFTKESPEIPEKEKQECCCFFFFFSEAFYYHKWKIWNKVDEEKRLEELGFERIIDMASGLSEDFKNKRTDFLRLD